MPSACTPPIFPDFPSEGSERQVLGQACALTPERRGQPAADVSPPGNSYLYGEPHHQEPFPEASWAPPAMLTRVSTRILVPISCCCVLFFPTARTLGTGAWPQSLWFLGTELRA